ncbi:MAG: hypothetical protein OXR66_08000 [Candidatus Woesearchaeota archaeon]|nr:hypothetical protein [Candidatus Woesearchaeota archaeon]
MTPTRVRGLLVLTMLLVTVTVLSLIPGNRLTGNVVAETCEEAGCLELCDSTCADESMVCCQTNWASGVCAYERSCEEIYEYSLYQSLEVYQDTIRTPHDFYPSWKRFWVPLVTVTLILVYVMYRRRT